MTGGRLVALPTGYRVGRYTLSSVLGEGGFGITYRARDEALRRDVAIKEYLPADVAVREADTTIRPRSASDTQLYHWGLQRFVDEARTLAAMSAPNIVAVHDFMETNGTGYMVMELIEGRSLAALLDRGGSLPADRLLPITRQLLAGLEAVHARGYLHRDIKPGNILIRPDGQPVLVDFGAARISRRSGTHAMTSVYTPGYAPAEQYAADGEQGPWTDIYALAATLYEAITGWPPPDATTRLLNDRMVPAAQAAAGKYPAAFLAGIDDGLGLRKENRPQSVAEWRAILFDEPVPADASASSTRAEPPTMIAGQRPSRSDAAAAPRPSRPGEPPSMRPPREASPSRRQPSVREPAPGGDWRREAPPSKRVRWPLVAGALVVLLVGVGGGLLASGGFGLFDDSMARQREADRRADEERRRQADLEEAERRRAADEEAARTKAAAAEAERRRRIDEEAARQRAADEEAARARAAEEARRRADEEAAARARAAEEEARRRADEAAKARADEEARRRADEEAARARVAEDARRRADEEAARARAAEAARRRADEEAARARAAEDSRRKADEEARARGADEARRRAAEDEARRRAADEARRRAAEEERRRREEAARSAHAGDGRWSAAASVQTHARNQVCMDSFTITGTASNGVLQASTTYGGPLTIRIGDDGMRAVSIAYNGRPVRTYWGNMRSTLLEFLDGCIYRINWTKQ